MRRAFTVTVAGELRRMTSIAVATPATKQTTAAREHDSTTIQSHEEESLCGTWSWLGELCALG